MEKQNVSVEKIVSEISKHMNQIMTYVHSLEEGLTSRDKHIIYLDEQIKRMSEEKAQKGE